MTRRRVATSVAIGAVLAVASVTAAAQVVRRPPAAPAAPSAKPTNIRARTGSDYAARLLRSSDADERIRGIRRAASVGSPETIALLVSTIENNTSVRSDPRALIELARALSRFADQERARAGLALIVNSAGLGATTAVRPNRGSDLVSDDLDRVELARQTAAIAIARSRTDRAFEQLYGIARSSGNGQAAALFALSVEPPREPGVFGTSGGALSPPVVRFLGRLGDLRALDVLHAAMRSTDVNVRAAAIVALAELGDTRALPLARKAIVETDARTRAAAGEAFTLLGAPDRFEAVTALLGDEATAGIGVGLAERVHSPEIARLLEARATSHPDLTMRLAAVRALGRFPSADALTRLASPKIVFDPNLQYPVLLAIARSPAPNAADTISALLGGKLRSLAIRAYVVRALVRGERRDDIEATVFPLAQSTDARDRALGVFVRVALGDANPASFFEDRDARVRRAAAAGAMARPNPATSRALLSRLVVEPDAATRYVLAAGLASGDPSTVLTTTYLLERATAGGPDAPLATYVVARRADERLGSKVGEFLSASDPSIRAHAARGLGFAALPNAAGLLANAYAYETDPDVRRAIVSALVSRTADASAPARSSTLDLAARLDPDGATRFIAQRAIDGDTAIDSPPATDAAWLRLEHGGTSAPDPYVGFVSLRDGLARPVVFDDEGFAVMGGLPPGPSRLVLAPRLPSYEAPRP